MLWGDVKDIVLEARKVVFFQMLFSLRALPGTERPGPQGAHGPWVNGP